MTISVGRSSCMIRCVQRRHLTARLAVATHANAKMAPQTVLFSLFVNTQCGESDNCTDIVQ